MLEREGERENHVHRVLSRLVCRFLPGDFSLSGLSTFETYNIFFYTNRPCNVNSLTKKASFLNLGGLRLGPGECGYEKTAVSTTRDSYGLSLTALSSKFEGLCHALRKIAEVILRETRPPTPSYYSSYDVWYSRYVRTRLYACLSKSLYWWL